MKWAGYGFEERRALREAEARGWQGSKWLGTPDGRPFSSRQRGKGVCGGGKLVGIDAIGINFCLEMFILLQKTW